MKDLDYTVLLLHNCVDTKNVRNPRINRSKKKMFHWVANTAKWMKKSCLFEFNLIMIDNLFE